MKYFFMLSALAFLALSFAIMLALALGIVDPWHSVLLAGSILLTWLCACEVERLEGES